MANFHINPETGEPGRCIAAFKCKYKLDAEKHYGTKEEARVAYEEQMSYDNLPKAVTNSQNLTNMAKNTTKNSEMKIVLQYGTSYEITHLARNTSVPAEHLETIWEKSGKYNREETKYIVALHPNCPVHLLDKPRLVHLGKQTRPDYVKKMQQLMQSDDVTNEQAAIVAEKGFPGSEQILANENTKVSQEVLRKLAFKNPSNLAIALENPKFDIDAAIGDENAPPELKARFEEQKPAVRSETV